MRGLPFLEATGELIDELAHARDQPRTAVKHAVYRELSVEGHLHLSIAWIVLV